MPIKSAVIVLIICSLPIIALSQNSVGSSTPIPTPVPTPNGQQSGAPGSQQSSAKDGQLSTTPAVSAVDVPKDCKQALNADKKNEQGTTPQGFDNLCRAGIGDEIIVEVKSLGNLSPSTLVLFLDGRPISGVNASTRDSADPNVSRLAFDLKRTEGSNAAWNALLAKPGFNPYRNVTVGLGSSADKEFAFADHDFPPRIRLRLYYPYWALGAFIALIFLLIWFWRKAVHSGIVRDSGPPLAAADKRPYSLARLQAAFWFFLVIGSFIFIFLVTGDYNTVTEQALILMGIGTGTALGAAMIDANKNDSANSQLADLNPEQAQLQTEIAQLQAKVDNGSATDADKVQLAAKQSQLDEISKKINDASSGLSKPTSDGFFKDLLTDVNGVNFHRFQMLVWTLVLGILFIAGVYSTLSMPQFSGTLLALMGISSGTYLGFKIPEKQS